MRPTRNRAVLVVKIGLAVAALVLCVSIQAAAPSLANPTLTFPQFRPGQALHLVAYGDSRFTDPAVVKGTNPRVRAWLASRIAQEHPEAVLLSGDTPFTGAKTEDWAEFQKETAGWRSENALELPTIGNHETYGGEREGIANYLKNFPEIANHRYYSALLGNVEVISLDMASSSAPSSPQARWFAAQLDHLPAQADFVLILFHIPWMADHQSEVFVNLPTPAALQLRTLLEARLPRIRAKVIVLNGHIHNYERFERKGVEYVITGGGGADPYPVIFRGADLYADPGFPVYHYVTLDVKGRTLRAVMWKVKDPSAPTLEVEKKDEFTLEAPPAPGGRKDAEVIGSTARWRVPPAGAATPRPKHANTMP